MREFVPKKPEKDIISIRIDMETLARVDHAAARVDISRNEFINQCIRFALSHLVLEGQSSPPYRG